MSTDIAEFTKTTVMKAWKRAEGRCDCIHVAHQHTGKRCYRKLLWESQATTYGIYRWEAHHIGNPDDNSPGNCEIL